MKFMNTICSYCLYISPWGRDEHYKTYIIDEILCTLYVLAWSRCT